MNEFEASQANPERSATVPEVLPESSAEREKPSERIGNPASNVRRKGTRKPAKKHAPRKAVSLARQTESRGQLGIASRVPVPGKLLLSAWRDAGVASIRLIQEFLDAQTRLPQAKRDIRVILDAADKASKHALGLKITLQIDDAALLRLCIRAAAEVYGSDLDRFATVLANLMEAPDKEAIEASFTEGE